MCEWRINPQADGVDLFDQYRQAQVVVQFDANERGDVYDNVATPVPNYT